MLISIKVLRSIAIYSIDIPVNNKNFAIDIFFLEKLLLSITIPIENNLRVIDYR